MFYVEGFFIGIFDWRFKPSYVYKIGAVYETKYRIYTS